LVQRLLKEFSPFLNLERAQITLDLAKEMVVGMLGSISQCPLSQGFALNAVHPSQQWSELEFYLPCQGLHAPKLHSLMLHHGLQIPYYQFDTLEGYLKGFIDLVFEHNGRWYVLDWKSNHLGDSPQDYASQAIQAEMDNQGYVLQAVLYSLALHRFLKQRLSDYAPSTHLGGALYVFLRGFRQEWCNTMKEGEAPGLWSFHPTEVLLNDLDALFNGQVMT